MFTQDNVYWWWVIASTTGLWQMTRYNVGEHVARSSNEGNFTIKWFARYVNGLQSKLDQKSQTSFKNKIANQRTIGPVKAHLRSGICNLS